MVVVVVVVTTTIVVLVVLVVVVVLVITMTTTTMTMMMVMMTYCTQGGLRAVVYTDTFQAAIIFTGILALIVKGIIDVGGVEEVWRRSHEGGRLDNFFK